MEKLKVEVFRIKPNYKDPFEFYSNPENSDFIKAKFSQWSGKKATEVTIVSSGSDREFKKINYCEDLDAIEIHCLVGGGITPNVGFKEKISNCEIDCVRVMVFEYEDEKNIKTCNENYYTPDTKKGNIIIGNP